MNVSVKNIHVKGNSENCNSASQENLKSSWDSLSHQGSISDESLNSLNTNKISTNDNGIKPIEVQPLAVNKKMTSDTSLYKSPNGNTRLSAKSSKSYIVIPTISKVHSIQSSKPVEMRHVTKKTSVSTISSDDSISALSDKAQQQQQPHIERNMSKLNGYDADILYEYFDEGSDGNEDLISDSPSVQNFIDEANKERNIRNNRLLSIKTDIRHNNTALNSCETMTSGGISSLDQVYNTISQELEERLCKTVRKSTLQRVDSKNFMVPINILYEKHFKTQVIYVERKMTIEEVLQQALNSINIYEDYGNYELLQVFGFEDIREEDEEENNDKSNRSSVAKYQNVINPMDKIQNILEEMKKNISKRKTNNILTFRIRKKSSSIKIPIFLEEEKKYYTVMVNKNTTCGEVIESLLFLQNENYTENKWYIEKKDTDNYESGKEILEASDELYSKEDNFKYILKRKKTKQMSKLANILGVADESDLHNIVDTNKSRDKDKDKDKASKSMNELLKYEPLKDDPDDIEELSEEKMEMFSRILSLPIDEINAIYGRNKKINEKKRLEAKKKYASLDQINSGSNLKDGERFSSQVFNLFKSKKEKRASKLRNSINTGSMPLLNDSAKESGSLIMSKYNTCNDFIERNDDDSDDSHSTGKRAKKLVTSLVLNLHKEKILNLITLLERTITLKKHLIHHNNLLLSEYTLLI